MGHFSFAAVRIVARLFALQGPHFRGPSLFLHLVEAAGLEPASVVAPE